MSYIMMGPNWKYASVKPQAGGCILLLMNVAGRRYCFGTRSVSIKEFVGGTNSLQFVDALLGDVSHDETVDPFNKSFSVQNMKFQLMAEFFPFNKFKTLGIPFQRMRAKVYWFVDGIGLALEQAFLMLEGVVSEPEYDEEMKTVSFTVEDPGIIGDKAFPPVIASSDLISTLVEDHEGKPYPVVIGSVKKLPLVSIDSVVAGDMFLVMHDKTNQWGSPAQVSAVYNGDTAMVEAAETQQEDTDGNKYVRLQTDANATSLDVTADVDGHIPADPVGAIRFLMSFFANEFGEFHLASLNKMDRPLSPVTLAMMFNNQSGTAWDIVRNRILQLVPASMLQNGAKAAFQALTWDRRVKKTLSFNKNVLDVVRKPVEVSRANLYSSFTLNYGRSGFRDDSTATLKRDHTNSAGCRRVRNRYGDKVMPVIDAGDIQDVNSARWLLNWYIETYTKTRVETSLITTMDTVDLRGWDGVQFFNEYEGWNHGPLFKVKGIRRADGPTFKIDLISHDDYIQVYGV